MTESKNEPWSEEEALLINDDGEAAVVVGEESEAEALHREADSLGSSGSFITLSELAPAEAGDEVDDETPKPDKDNGEEYEEKGVGHMESIARWS